MSRGCYYLIISAEILHILLILESIELLQSWKFLLSNIFCFKEKKSGEKIKERKKTTVLFLLYYRKYR